MAPGISVDQLLAWGAPGFPEPDPAAEPDWEPTPEDVVQALELAYDGRQVWIGEPLGATPSEDKQAASSGTCLTYGEVHQDGLTKLLGPRGLDLRGRGSRCLLELGSGRGRLALQAFLQFPEMQVVVGVELVSSRHRSAAQAARRLQERFPNRFRLEACQSFRFGLVRSLPRRQFSSQSAIIGTLQEKIKALGEKKAPQVQSLRKEHGGKSLGDVTVGMCIGGMRGIKCMVSETSHLDPMEGIRYRGRTLKECNEQLTKAEGGKVGLPESAFWLLLTDEMPTEAQTRALTAELHAREALPAHVEKLVDGLPKDMHPMTQLSMGLLALQPDSVFGKAYRAGAMKKTDYWTYVLEDSLTLVAKMPILSARIFRNVYCDGKHIPSDKSLDWAGNYAQMLGVNDSPAFKEVTRLYLMIHADHEAGNVSAHTTHLVGSALSDPFLSFSAGVNGLAGPLHGLANQECLRWLKNTQKTLGGKEPTVEILTQFAKDTLASGKVIPGFGHGALRTTDPRYTIQSEFAKEHMPQDPLFKLANVCYQAIPPVLEATGKVANPWPNVDALSGTCMQHYGLNQEDYYTVVFAVSRALGCTANLVWSRLMGLPIERPKSVTLDWIEKNTK